MVVDLIITQFIAVKFRSFSTLYRIRKYSFAGFKYDRFRSREMIDHENQKIFVIFFSLKSIKERTSW